MHEQRPSDPEGDSLPAERAKPAWRTGAGVAGAAALFFAKFKGLLLVLVNLKWLVFAPKLLLSFGSLFLSIWFYALFFGWKFGIVFVLLILVHELGHYVTFRNFGIDAKLPFFIPGFGAFVAARGPAPSMTVEAIATLAGPVFGIAASAMCYAYAFTTHEPFWYAAAYVGFFLNALNLLPVPPFDGGRIAGTIDPRLWIVGLAAFIGFIVVYSVWSPFTILMIAIVAIGAIPRIYGLFKGRIDPRLADLPMGNRWAIAGAYFVTLAIAVVGALASHVVLPAAPTS